MEETPLDVRESDERRGTSSAEWPVWSTTARIVVTDPLELGHAERIACDLLDEVDAACSRFRPDSELSRLAPHLAEGVWVSETLALLLRCALDAAERSHGAVDPTVGDALSALGYDRDIRLVRDDAITERMPAPAVLGPSLGSSRGWRAVALTGRYLRVVPRRTLDLGATAKAVAADLVAGRVARECGCGVLVSLGGDIATAGRGPHGHPWEVLVRDTPDDPAAHITLAPGWGLATSSTQRRTWRRGDRLLHHIVDPRTGAPADPVWRTVSVAAPTCLEANVASTAAVVRGRTAPDALGLARRPARLVAADGSVVVLNGWPAERASAEPARAEHPHGGARAGLRPEPAATQPSTAQAAATRATTATGRAA